MACRRLLMAIVLRMICAAMLVAAGFGVSNAGDGDSRKVALVIGNSKYEELQPLRNPRNDERLIKRALSRLDFDVTAVRDLNYEDFERTLEDFADEAQDADVVLFYYAGHGFQFEGKNFLVPVDARLKNRKTFAQETFSLDDILTKIRGPHAQTLVFLDACRNNPMPASARAERLSTGLAMIDSNSYDDTYFAFSTQPGNVSVDGNGDNSPFALALAKYVPEEDKSVSDMMIDVRNAVAHATNNRQIPWDNSSLRKRFYFSSDAQDQQDDSPDQQKSGLTKEMMDAISKLPPDQQATMLMAYAQTLKGGERKKPVVDDEDAGGDQDSVVRNPEPADEATDKKNPGAVVAQPTDNDSVDKDDEDTSDVKAQDNATDDATQDAGDKKPAKTAKVVPDDASSTDQDSADDKTPEDDAKAQTTDAAADQQTTDNDDEPAKQTTDPVDTAKQSTIESHSDDSATAEKPVDADAGKHPAESVTDTTKNDGEVLPGDTTQPVVKTPDSTVQANAETTQAKTDPNAGKVAVVDPKKNPAKTADQPAAASTANSDEVPEVQLGGDSDDTASDDSDDSATTSGDQAKVDDQATTNKHDNATAAKNSTDAANTSPASDSKASDSDNATTATADHTADTASKTAEATEKPADTAKTEVTPVEKTADATQQTTVKQPDSTVATTDHKADTASKAADEAAKPADSTTETNVTPSDKTADTTEQSTAKLPDAAAVTTEHEADTASKTAEATTKPDDTAAKTEVTPLEKTAETADHSTEKQPDAAETNSDSLTSDNLLPSSEEVAKHSETPVAVTPSKDAKTEQATETAETASKPATADATEAKPSDTTITEPSNAKAAEPSEMKVAQLEVKNADAELAKTEPDTEKQATEDKAETTPEASIAAKTTDVAKPADVDTQIKGDTRAKDEDNNNAKPADQADNGQIIGLDRVDPATNQVIGRVGNNQPAEQQTTTVDKVDDSAKPEEAKTVDDLQGGKDKVTAKPVDTANDHPADQQVPVDQTAKASDTKPLVVASLESKASTPNDALTPSTASREQLNGEEKNPADEKDYTLDIQTELGRLGCLKSTPDGKWGRGSKEALKKYETSKGRTSIGEDKPSLELLKDLQGEKTEVCAEVADNGKANSPTAGKDTSRDSADQDTAGRDTAGRDTEGKDTAGKDTGRETANKDTGRETASKNAARDNGRKAREEANREKAENARAAKERSENAKAEARQRQREARDRDRTRENARQHDRQKTERGRTNPVRKNSPERNQSKQPSSDKKVKKMLSISM